MPAMKMRVVVALVPLAALAPAIPALAGDEQIETLPGVSRQPDIVTTLPPEPTDDPADPTHFKIGDTEVRISGSIRIDVTAGGLPPPR